MKTLNQEFENYMQAVYGNNWEKLHITQFNECKRAFMAGCWVMINACLTVSDASYTEEQGVEILDKYHQELQQFNNGQQFFGEKN